MGPPDGCRSEPENFCFPSPQPVNISVKHHQTVGLKGYEPMGISPRKQISKHNVSDQGEWSRRYPIIRIPHEWYEI